jgi:hypothetical protein
MVALVCHLLLSKPLWPVTLETTYPEDGTLFDGWHRFHDYYRKGVKEVPFAWYHNEDRHANRDPNEAHVAGPISNTRTWGKTADIVKNPDGTIRNRGPMRDWLNEDKYRTDMGEPSFPIWEEDYPYYHVAPTSERARIMQHGLQASSPQNSGQWTDPDVSWQVENQPTGTYLWDNKNDASDYVDQYERRTKVPMDVWGINHPNLPTTYDNVVPQARITPYSIGPEHLKMIYGPEHREQREGDIPAAAYIPQFPEQQALKENARQWGIGKPNRVIGNRGPATESSAKTAAIVPQTFNVQACPRCGGHMDPETGACMACGYMIPYDGYEVMEGHDNPYQWSLEQPWTHEMDTWDLPRNYGALELPPRRNRPFQMPEVLYHWTEARNAPWIHENGFKHDRSLFDEGPDPGDINPDVPELETPFRIDVDPSQLDPSLFGQDKTEGYAGDLASNLDNHGNTYYTGPIPRSAIIGMKKFKPARREWEF